MMKAQIYELNYGMKKAIVCTDGDRHMHYNFNSKLFEKTELGALASDDCAIDLPIDVYNAIAQAIKADDSVPSPKRDFIEGKLEAIETHLEDMRKLVFKKK